MTLAPEDFAVVRTVQDADRVLRFQSEVFSLASGSPALLVYLTREVGTGEPVTPSGTYWEKLIAEGCVDLVPMLESMMPAKRQVLHALTRPLQGVNMAQVHSAEIQQYCAGQLAPALGREATHSYLAPRIARDSLKGCLNPDGSVRSSSDLNGADDHGGMSEAASVIVGFAQASTPALDSKWGTPEHWAWGVALQVCCELLSARLFAITALL
ncbi:hypothetical protein WJX73_002487 [Symbiochloris irregularis]|uniref:Uncharacterized protein n=1 Tax=Symbiochloris irregularis TaxID=706552 RepID=A0AAW1P0T2_9CHLO